MNIQIRCHLDLEFLPILIDTAKLVEVKFEGRYFNKYNINFLFNIISILEQSSSLSSFIINSRFFNFELYPFLNDLCSVIPRQIKHLQIPINQLDQVKKILDRCPNLSSAQFQITRLKCSQEVIHWFNENTVDSKIKKSAECHVIWIGRKINNIEVSNKRIKLSSD